MPVVRETMLHRMHDIWMCSNNDMCFMVRSMLKNLAESAASLTQIRSHVAAHCLCMLWISRLRCEIHRS